MSNAVYIDLLRVRGVPGLSNETMRLRLEQLLSGVSWSELGFGPASVLCVRSLRDPKPNVVSLAGEGGSAPHLWQRALAEALSMIVRRAERPVYGLPSVQCEAVLFGDQAEMLSCFLSDWLDGMLGARWWWRSLMGSVALERPLHAVVERWLRDSAYLPGTIAHLAARRQLERLGNALSDDVSVTLAGALSSAYGADGWTQLVKELAAGRPRQNEGSLKDEAPVQRTEPAGAAGAIAARGADTVRTMSWPPGSEQRLPTTSGGYSRFGVTTPHGPAAAGDSEGAGGARASHDVEAVCAMSPPPGSEARLPTTDVGDSRLGADAPNGPAAAGDFGNPCPWTGQVPEVSPGRLSAAVESLLVACLLAHREPIRFRDVQVLTSVRRWYALDRDEGPRGDPHAGTNVGRSPSRLLESAAGAVTQRGRAMVSMTVEGDAPRHHLVDAPSRRAHRPGQEPVRGVVVHRKAANESSDHLEDPGVAVPSHAAEPSMEHLEAPGPVPHHRAGEASLDHVRPGQSSIAARAFDIGARSVVLTELGGLFYLVNVLLYFELCGDFTRPAEPGLQLPIWDMITLLGRELLGEHTSVRDPVWSLLAVCAGRSVDEPAGCGFVPPDGWSPSPTGDGAALEDERAFAAYDSPSEATAQTAPSDGEQGIESAALQRWIRQVAVHVESRLRAVLGVGAEESVGEVLLRHRASVVVTASHVDVTFSLAELPIRIRLSGLDRDPGWVPAAGRIVGFHFE